MELLLETNLSNLYYRGKVRDTYDLGDSLLVIATDRISAFDSVLEAGSVAHKLSTLDERLGLV